MWRAAILEDAVRRLVPVILSGVHSAHVGDAPVHHDRFLMPGTDWGRRMRLEQQLELALHRVLQDSKVEERGHRCRGQRRRQDPARDIGCRERRHHGCHDPEQDSNSNPRFRFLQQDVVQGIGLPIDRIFERQRRWPVELVV
jgi:hypothetical protein